MTKGGLLIKNIGELVTCSGTDAKRGAGMSDLGVIRDAAVLVEDGVIRAVGKAGEIEKPGLVELDARGNAVLPGFVDAHTHFVFGGYRQEEFFWRISGRSYLDILKKGGGILSTVQATRAATAETLVEAGRRRLDGMLSFGVTTVEGKSGYGLDRDTEIKQLEAMRTLSETHPVDIAPTFLGAHAVPEEYRGKGDEYIDFILDVVLPEVAERKLCRFCDVFCEKGVFSLEQSGRLLLGAKKLGMGVKIHADEIHDTGGAGLAARLGAVSADHLLHASDGGIDEMARAGTVAVLLPNTAFCLGETYARARDMIDRGIAVALATDMNPGSCFSESIPLLFALGTMYMGMSAEEAVTAVTINAAAAVGMAESIGSIDVGKKADMVILQYPSYRYLPYRTGVSCVEKVIKNGKTVYDRSRSLVY
ncbi:MAG: imidazolonepropionase [Spirochaetes bacterium]|nr:imidazolonepropionase [Spirochaetota bacterium]